MKDGSNGLIEFAIAYWGKRWVCVPLFHLPAQSAQDLKKIGAFLPVDAELKVEIEEEARAYQKIHPIETIIPWLWNEKELQELCKMNNIPIGWVLGKQTKKPTKRSAEHSRRDDRKIPSLKGREIQKILTRAKKLNPQHGIVLKLLWFLNKNLSNSGTFVTLEEVLRMQVRDISHHHQHGCNWVNLYRRNPSGGHLVAFSLPEYLWKAVRSQIDDTSLFVFSNRHGGPIHPLQIDKTLQVAADLVGVKEVVTSLSLRPPYEKQRIDRVAKRHRYERPTNDHLKEITDQEWSSICKSVPEILTSRGRKSKYRQLDILNAILYHFRTRCPMRKLPESFPRCQAVESQMRRWEKSGILQKILAHRST